jgi:glucokinase
LDSLLLNEGFYQKYIATLSRGLATVINLLDPAKVILGGGIINFGQKLLNDLNQSVKNQLDRPSGWMPPIDFSILGDQNVLFGAEELIKREILK